MQKYLTLFLTVFIFHTSFSQDIQGRVTYSFIVDYKNMPNQAEKDSCVLFFKGQQAVYIEKPQILKPITETKTTAVEEANFKVSTRSIEYSTHYYKSLDKGKIYEEVYDEKNPYYLDDPMPDFGWAITNEVKNIGGYDCAKAISKNFRGRVYEAWFTYFIPSSHGPWKLGGLPGLILEAYDQKGEIKFLFTSLQVPNQDKVSYAVPQGVTFISWDEHRKNVQKKIEDAFKRLEAITGGKRNMESQKSNSIESFDY